MKERIKGRAAYRSVQLFSNYIFVSIVDQWRAVRSTKGILDLLMLEHEVPAFVREDYITGLKAREDKDGFVVLKQSKFKKDDVVQVKHGAFAFQNGLFEGVSSHDRVFILLSMLGTQRRVELSEDNLVAV